MMILEQARSNVAQGRVAQGALARLAAVLVQPGETFREACTVAEIIGRLSWQDRLVVDNIIRRVAEMESRLGQAAAEAALNDVIGLLSEERGGAC